MTKKPQTSKDAAEKVVKNIRKPVSSATITSPLSARIMVWIAAISVGSSAVVEVGFLVI